MSSVELKKLLVAVSRFQLLDSSQNVAGRWELMVKSLRTRRAEMETRTLFWGATSQLDKGGDFLSFFGIHFCTAGCGKVLIFFFGLFMSLSELCR